MLEDKRCIACGRYPFCESIEDPQQIRGCWIKKSIGGRKKCLK